MGEKLTDREMEALDRCYREAAGKGWEPRGGTDTPGIRKFVAAGFLRVTDGRSGFERIKDCMVTWTDAGRQVMSSRTTIASLSEALAEAEKKGAEALRHIQEHFPGAAAEFEAVYERTVLPRDLSQGGQHG